MFNVPIVAEVAFRVFAQRVVKEGVEVTDKVIVPGAEVAMTRLLPLEKV